LAPGSALLESDLAMGSEFLDSDLAMGSVQDYTSQHLGHLGKASRLSHHTDQILGRPGMSQEASNRTDHFLDHPGTPELDLVMVGRHIPLQKGRDQLLDLLDTELIHR